MPGDLCWRKKFGNGFVHQSEASRRKRCSTGYVMRLASRGAAPPASWRTFEAGGGGPSPATTEVRDSSESPLTVFERRPNSRFGRLLFGDKRTATN